MSRKFLLSPKWLRLGVLALLCGIVLVVVWLRIQSVQESKKIHELAISAISGDRDSLEQLRDRDSSVSREVLKQISFNRGVFSDIRINAIHALGTKNPIDEEAFVQLLRVDEPFAVRHAATEELLRARCTEPCTSRALEVLHAIFRGEPTAESIAAKKASDVLRQNGIESLSNNQVEVEQLRRQAESDMFALLCVNKSATKSLLLSKYGQDSPFVEFVGKNVNSH